MSDQPTISVVIPAYNSEKFVADAIKSVLAQTVPPLEIIVVDDGSTDGTSGIVSRFSSSVRPIRQGNEGPASARNHGIREAKGEWIALLDADDTWLPQKLERQILHTNDSKIGVIHAFSEGWKREESGRGNPDFKTLWLKNSLITSSVLMRKSACEEVGYFEEDRALIAVEDYNLWLRFAHAGWEIVTCAEPLMRYTPAAGNLSSQIERFAAAELANVEDIGQRLKLPQDSLHAKRIAIYEEYGRDLLYERHLTAARKMLSIPLRDHPTPARLKWWLATLIPRSLLDWRRSRTQPQNL
ncbi:MAG: glycosyltransferase family 2 protein [Chthonomonadaceae bacterium]|nr:glycosyltransferase family 2 protein [Chthonomonadaceae bacterium]